VGNERAKKALAGLTIGQGLSFKMLRKSKFQRLATLSIPSDAFGLASALASLAST
jgi:hypothetical protein